MVERTVLVDGNAGPIEVRVSGRGGAVVLIASLGRGATDFDTLAVPLVDAGYQVICPEPRGVGRSAIGPANPTLADLADDIAAVIRVVADTVPVTVGGHAFGNRVARMVATTAPELVDRVVLFACGGKIPPAPDAARALVAVFDDSLSSPDHMRAVQTAFFAPGNDPTVWDRGWYGPTAAIQRHASGAVAAAQWWSAGRASVLVIQPADDVIAPPGNALDIIGQLGDRATLVTIANAGHALLPEQPDAVADALIHWLEHGVGRGA